MKLLDHLLSMLASEPAGDGIENFCRNAVTTVTSITQAASDALKPSEEQNPYCPGSDLCAGCYSIGVLDGRERFIHPPKPSTEWEAWLKRWEPKGRIQ
jgi:hypothetical protein